MQRQRSAWPLALALAVLAAPACTKSRYHWEDVPYCAAPDGGPAGGRFETPLRVIQKYGGGGGTWTLHGMRPTVDVAFDDEVLVAVVACTSGDLIPAARDLKDLLAGFTETKVPLVCEGQRVVVRPVRVKAQPTRQAGLQGKLQFPKVPDAELACSAGTVALGSGVP